MVARVEETGEGHDYEDEKIFRFHRSHSTTGGVQVTVVSRKWAEMANGLDLPSSPPLDQEVEVKGWFCTRILYPPSLTTTA